MADIDRIKANIFMHCALPLLKVVKADNKIFDMLFKIPKTTAIVQFRVKDQDIGAYMEFKNGELEIVQGIHPKPTVLFAFSSASKMNDFFGGKPAIPDIKCLLPGLLRLDLIARVVPLLLSLMILLPQNVPTDPAKKAMKVKLLIYMVSCALSQLNKSGDEPMMEFAKTSPDRVYQWTVENGPAAYLRVKAGNTKSGRGTYERRRPFVHMIFPDIEGAFKVLTNQVTLVEAIKHGYIKTEGPPEFARDIGIHMQRIEAMLK